MTSCFEVAIALTEASHVNSDDLDAATTILVETLLATGVIEERSRAVEDMANEEEVYTAAEYAAAADDAMGDFEDEIHQAEIMMEAKERRLSDEKIIIEADTVIEESARLATSTLVDKGLVDGASSDKVAQLIAQAWSSAEE